MNVEKDSSVFIARGTGFNFIRPILLNDISGFDDFKSFCGNFGIGFQNITKHSFCKSLIGFANEISSLNQLYQQKIIEQDLVSALQSINEQMKLIEPEKRISEIEQTIRNDRQIVSLLKKAANYKCQFPNCEAEIKTKAGINYVEVAHISPVNEGGQSILGNLLVLCPNHHKEFDLGSLTIIEQSSEKIVGTLNGKYFQIELYKTGN